VEHRGVRVPEPRHLRPFTDADSHRECIFEVTHGSGPPPKLACQRCQPAIDRPKADDARTSRCTRPTTLDIPERDIHRADRLHLQTFAPIDKQQQRLLAG
jgi:hypothetical protein